MWVLLVNYSHNTIIIDFPFCIHPTKHKTEQPVSLIFLLWVTTLSHSFVSGIPFLSITVHSGRIWIFLRSRHHWPWNDTHGMVQSSRRQKSIKFKQGPVLLFCVILVHCVQGSRGSHPSEDIHMFSHGHSWVGSTANGSCPSGTELLPLHVTYINAMEIIIELVPCQTSMDEQFCPCCYHYMTMPGGWRFSKCLWLWPGQSVCIKHMKFHILHGLGTSLSTSKDIQLVSNGCWRRVKCSWGWWQVDHLWYGPSPGFRIQNLEAISISWLVSTSKHPDAVRCARGNKAGMLIPGQEALRGG